MDYIPRTLCLWSLCALGTNSLPAVDSSPANLEISIIPSGRNEKFAAIRMYNDHEPFFVVIANRGSESINFWKEWCSWGYFALSFEMKLADGRTLEIKKQSQGWQRNFPDSFLVRAGDYFVIPVAFSDKIWTGLPDFRGSQEVELRARYHSRYDRDDAMEAMATRSAPAFDGEIESAWLAVTLFR